MANALVGAIPLTAGISDPEEQQAVMQLAYTLAGADRQRARRPVAVPEDPNIGGAVCLPDETTLPAAGEKQATAQVGKFLPAARNLGVRRIPDDRHELPDARPCKRNEVKPLVTLIPRPCPFPAVKMPGGSSR